MERIVIRFTELPESDDPEKILSWFCSVFGLSGGAESGIEEELLMRFAEAAYLSKGLTSSEITEGMGLPRSTLIYRLNRFIDAGLVVKRGRKYYLRGSEMAKAIEEIEYDVHREMTKLLNTARAFDSMMNTKVKGLKKGA